MFSRIDGLFITTVCFLFNLNRYGESDRIQGNFWLRITRIICTSVFILFDTGTGTVRRGEVGHSCFSLKEICSAPLRLDPILGIITFHTVDLGGLCIRRLFCKFDDGIIRGGRNASRIHLRQGTHGGESHVDYALDPFSEGLVGACYSLGRKKDRR